MTAQPPSETKEKSEKELEKERQKAEKLKKFEAKKAQQQSNGSATALPARALDKRKQESKDHLDSADYFEDTQVGDKKILKPLDDKWHKAYVPKVVESGWYDWWEKQGFLKPQFSETGAVKEAGKFVIVIPPPNVTGALVGLFTGWLSVRHLLIYAALWPRTRELTTRCADTMVCP